MAWELSAQRPIWSQLVEQIQLRIVTGRYPAGSRLPSVRELAADASVNPNTMQRALSQLEADGLVCSQRTSGRFVTEQEETIMELKKTLAQNLVRDFLTRIEALGYTAKEAVQLLKAEDAAQFRTEEEA